jgi:hypothetical protein
MTLPHYLQQFKLADLPVNYPWTRLIANGLQANPGEDHPKLFDAIELIDNKAAFALGIACSEWVAARLEKHIDISDALARCEAAWAATIDWRYTDLPEPATPPKRPVPDPVIGPLWLSQLLLSDDHQYYVKTYRKVKNNGVRGCALALALLGSHITARPSPFESWLSTSFRKASQHYPATKKSIETGQPVAREFFEPDFTWSPTAAIDSQARLLKTLDPAANFYLRSRDQMRADGFVGDPYPHLP